MEKYIEVKGKDRYHLSNVSIDEFIDCMLLDSGLASEVKDITEEEFEQHPNRKDAIIFDVEGKFTATFYYKEYSSEEFKAEWLEAIR